MLSDDEDEFVAFHIPRKSLSTEFRGKYRIYFRDGTSQDFAAETVTQALAQLDDNKKNKVMKIINLETEYRKTLKNNFLLSTEESVPTQISPDENAPKNLGFYFFGDLANEDESTSAEPFESMSLVDIAARNAGGHADFSVEEDAQVEQANAQPEVTEVTELHGEEALPSAPTEVARLSPQEVRDLLNDEQND